MPWALKYRPKMLDEVLGQSTAKDIIRGALKKTVEGTCKGMSWLLCGSWGCGKTSICRIIAKAVACHNPTPKGEACQVCQSCQAIEAEVSQNYVEEDAASRSGINDMRALIQEIDLAPVGGSRFRTIALDEAHALSTPAQNALLKSVENPSYNTHIIFITTDWDKLLDTIRSRCIIVVLEPVDHKTLVNRLAQICTLEHVEFELPALDIIVAQSRGHVRDAIVLTETISLAGSITLDRVKKSLHLELATKVAQLVAHIGLDWTKTAEVIDVLVQDYPASAVWKAVHQIITQAEVYRLLPNRLSSVSEHVKTLVDRYGPRITVAAEWVLKDGESLIVRTDMDLIVAMSVLNEQLGVPIAATEATALVKKIGVPKAKQRHMFGKQEPVEKPEEFAQKLGFELESE